MDLNVDSWTYIGETRNGKVYTIEPDIMAAVPFLGIRDTEEMAREAVGFQNAFWKKVGHGGSILIFADRMASLDKEARRVYQHELDPELMYGAGLIGMNLLTRAIGSFFLGLSKPTIPIKMLKDLDEGLTWARAINQAALAKKQGGA
jgi:hypothetical protein